MRRKGKGAQPVQSLEERLRGYAPLWGHWRPEQRIYRSGSCCVYTLSGGQEAQGFACVVKVVTILGQGEQAERQLADVRQEVAALERLRGCAQVVTVYDDACFAIREQGETVGWDVLLRMERLDCVAELLHEEQALPPSAVQTLAADIAAALAAVHRAGLIHRDVKPANLYRTPEGRFQLGDFGVARRCRAGMLQTVTGTTAYMAPEVARGEGYDARADLYSLGVVLYQLLNRGQLPLMEEDTPFAAREDAVRRRWQGAKLPPPPEGSRRLKRIVLRCCQPQPQRRYASADELLRALQGQPPRGWKAMAAAGWVCAALAAVLLGVPRLSAPSVATELTSVAPAQGPRYAVVQATMTWDEARVYCEARGGHLATVTSQQQMDTITALLEQNGLETVWLGANNYTSSGGFQWVTGEPFEFAAWGIGEPNNEGGQEHYLMMYHKEGQGWVWNDSVSNGTTVFDAAHCGFVCQWDDGDGSGG